MSTMILQSCYSCSGEYELQLEELDYDEGAEFCPECRWVGFEYDDDVVEIPVGLVVGREFMNGS